MPASQFMLGMLVGAGLLGAGLTLGGAGQDDVVTDVLRTRQIEVVDDAGTVRLLLGSNTEGGSISVRDRLGRTILQAGATKHGGTLVVRDTSGTTRPVLTAGATAGGGAITLFEGGVNRVVELVAERAGGRLSLGRAGVSLADEAALRLGVDAGGAGSIDGYAPGSGKLFTLAADSGLGGLIETYKQSELHPLVTLSSTTSGHGQIKTSATGGRTLVRITATADDEGQIYTYGGNGQPLVAIASRSTGPSIRLFNRLGRPLVSLESNATGQGAVGVWNDDGSGRTFTP